MGQLILILALADVRHLPVVESRVDCMEQHTYYDDCGKVVFTQVIFWTWDNDACRFQVLAWRLLNKPSMLPARYEMIWLDGETLRRVRYGEFRRSHSQADHEMLERSVLGTNERRELGK